MMTRRLFFWVRPHRVGAHGRLAGRRPDLGRARLHIRLRLWRRLNRPTSFAFGSDGAIYVTNNGPSTTNGKVLRIVQ
jgi:hypothetical protein